MSDDDVLHRFRLALFARAGKVGVTDACRQFGVHRSTYSFCMRSELEFHPLKRQRLDWTVSLRSLLPEVLAVLQALERDIVGRKPENENRELEEAIRG